MKYHVGLNNKDCLFDTGSFDTLKDALDFARNRGGVYSVNIGTDANPLGVHLSYNTENKTFYLDLWGGWEPIQEDKLSQYI